MSEASSAKPRVRVLTCLWGDSYIDHWLGLSLPSLLAPGNLPALAEKTEIEVLVLTRQADIENIRKDPIFSDLVATCPTRFIPIDDLIAGIAYGVTLTLAYARGVRDSGDRQTETFFVFMNSDFILSDGSLEKLGEKILEGRACVVAPSLRATSEMVLPRLYEALDPSGRRLTVGSRQLVRMALENLHPTTIGKIMDQDVTHCVSFNQLYWRVDDTTLLGRSHLIFMLCLKPERPLGPINSYCDYGFIPEMTPSSPMFALADSDDFFMLETGDRQQERSLLRIGSASIRKIARHLQDWTTEEHRRAAQIDCVFHSGELPANLEQKKKEATAFITRLHSLMRQAVSHVNHHYWVSGVQVWLRTQINGPQIDLPRELHGPMEPWLRRYARLLWRLRLTPPAVPIWMYDWLEFHEVNQWLSARSAEEEKSILLICPKASHLRAGLLDDPRIDVVTVPDRPETLILPVKQYRYILGHFHGTVLSRPEEIEPILDALPPGGEGAFLFGELQREPRSMDLHDPLTDFFKETMRIRGDKIQWKLAPICGVYQRKFGIALNKLIALAFTDGIRGEIKWAPIALPLIPMVLLLAIGILNITGFDRLARHRSDFRSAAFLRCRKIEIR